MARILINPKQTQKKALYQDHQGVKVLFDRDNGYAFSDDSTMDETIEHFKSLGFKFKGQKAGLSQTKKVEEEVKKEVPKENFKKQ